MVYRLINNMEFVIDVISMQCNGSLDLDLNEVPANELMQWGLQNLYQDGEEGPYQVQHGNIPVSDFGRPRHGEEANPDRENFFEKAFPTLYCYGVGGIERDQETNINFVDHVRWSYMYHDRHFRLHETFMFVAFGIDQRRQALRSVKIQMSSRNFAREAHLMARVTDLRIAAGEEAEHHRISNVGVWMLRKNVQASASRVSGSDQTRIRLQSQIWSTSIYLNPPSLWITINPCDLHDPIAQIFAGEEIDIDNFIATAGPSKNKRAQNIADDPYVAAKFFHFMVRTILRTLFGVDHDATHKAHKLISKRGVLGDVAAYFGTVESQKRGTLHLHLMVWLKNVPSVSEMRTLLQSEQFREKVKGYIRANIRAMAEGLETEADVKNTENEVEIGFNRSPNPDEEDYDAKAKDFLRRVVRAKQVHTCEMRRCLKLDSSGRIVANVDFLSTRTWTISSIAKGTGVQNVCTAISTTMFQVSPWKFGAITMGNSFPMLLTRRTSRSTSVHMLQRNKAMI